MMTSDKTLVFCLAALLALPLAAPHLDGGQDREVDGLVVDLGHTPKTLVSGEPVQFVANVANATTKRAVPADTAWVRIAGEKTLFSGELAKPGAGASFSLSFPRAGEYDATVRFSRGGERLVQTTFDLDVQSPMRPSLPLVLAFCVFLFGLGVYWARNPPIPL